MVGILICFYFFGLIYVNFFFCYKIVQREFCFDILQNDMIMGFVKLEEEGILNLRNMYVKELEIDFMKMQEFVIFSEVVRSLVVWVMLRDFF